MVPAPRPLTLIGHSVLEKKIFEYHGYIHV